MGANTALKTAEIAGQFFNNYPSKSAYQAFNEAMKSATDEMINDSMFLFSFPSDGNSSEALR